MKEHRRIQPERGMAQGEIEDYLTS